MHLTEYPCIAPVPVKESNGYSHGMRNEITASRRYNKKDIALIHRRDTRREGASSTKRKASSILSDKMRVAPETWERKGRWTLSTGESKSRTRFVESGQSAYTARKPRAWANAVASPETVILTGEALGGRALRASRCCQVMRQCARCARERGEGVETSGETAGACTVTRWLRCHRIQARRG